MSFVASQGMYGALRVFLDLHEADETCSKHRVARLMRENRRSALHGYRTRRWSVGKPAVLIANPVLVGDAPPITCDDQRGNHCDAPQDASQLAAAPVTYS